MPKKRTTFFSLRYEKHSTTDFECSKLHDTNKICNLQDASFFPFQPSLIKQESELHRNAARSLIYTDD